MKFKKYNSIEKAYRTKFIMMVEDSINMGFCKDDFDNEEKVQAENFSLY